MKARPVVSSSVAAALTLAATVLTAIPAEAQRPGAPPPPRVMVATFQTNEPGAGVQFAEALRARLGRDAPARDLTVIPKSDIENTLRQSGYSTTEALNPNDAKALASLIRAKDYIDGTVTRTPTGYRVDARLVLSRDNTVAQALPPADGARLDQAAAAISRSYLQARRQIEHEEKCYNALRGGNVEEAIRHANTGLREHPDANMVRVCLANAYVTRDSPQGGDQVISPATLQLVEQVVATDPRNIQALRLAALGYKAAGNEDKYVETLTGLLAAAPTDLTLQQQVVNELAASGRASLAAPIIKEALGRSSGDPSMLRTAWLVLLAARDYEAAIPVGRDLIVADTAQASADFYRRMAGALSAVTNDTSDAGRARGRELVTVLNAGTAKFPGDAQLLVALAEGQRKAGNVQEAKIAARRALTANPAAPEPYVILATIYGDANQPDSVYAVLASAPGGDAATMIAQLALQQGNNAYRAGNSSRNRADFQRAVRFLELSNRLSPSNAAQFLLGASAFSIGQSATTDASQSRSCELARLAQQSFTTARANIPAGREEFPEPTSQLMAALPQFETPVSQMVRQFCR